MDPYDHSYIRIFYRTAVALCIQPEGPHFLDRITKISVPMPIKYITDCSAKFDFGLSNRSYGWRRIM